MGGSLGSRHGGGSANSLRIAVTMINGIEVYLSSNLVLSPLFNVFPTGPHSKGLGSTSSYTALPEPGNAGGRADMRGSGNDRGPVTTILLSRGTSTSLLSYFHSDSM